MTIGEQIKKIRQENKLSQKGLGEKLGVSQQMIGQWETGKSNPKIETLDKIANALKVPIGDLMPDTYEREMQEAYEFSTTDYGLIEAMVNHPIFSDKEREMVFQKIEQYRAALVEMDDSDKLFKYSKKTHNELESILLKIVLDKCTTSDVIIILSCFLSLKERAQNNIIEILLEHCYPDMELKYNEWPVPPQS